MARGKGARSAKSTTKNSKAAETVEELDASEDDTFGDDVFLDDDGDEESVEDMYVDFGQPLLEPGPGRPDVSFLTRIQVV